MSNNPSQFVRPENEYDPFLVRSGRPCVRFGRSVTPKEPLKRDPCSSSKTSEYPHSQSLESSGRIRETVSLTRLGSPPNHSNLITVLLRGQDSQQRPSYLWKMPQTNSRTHKPYSQPTLFQMEESSQNMSSHSPMINREARSCSADLPIRLNRRTLIRQSSSQQQNIRKVSYSRIHEGARPSSILTSGDHLISPPLCLQSRTAAISPERTNLKPREMYCSPLEYVTTNQGHFPSPIIRQTAGIRKPLCMNLPNSRLGSGHDSHHSTSIRTSPLAIRVIPPRAPSPEVHLGGRSLSPLVSYLPTPIRSPSHESAFERRLTGPVGRFTGGDRPLVNPLKPSRISWTENPTIFNITDDFEVSRPEPQKSVSPIQRQSLPPLHPRRPIKMAPTGDRRSVSYTAPSRDDLLSQQFTEVSTPNICQIEKRLSIEHRPGSLKQESDRSMRKSQKPHSDNIVSEEVPVENLNETGEVFREMLQTIERGPDVIESRFQPDVIESQFHLEGKDVAFWEYESAERLQIDLTADAEEQLQGSNNAALRYNRDESSTEVVPMTCTSEDSMDKKCASKIQVSDEHVESVGRTSNIISISTPTKIPVHGEMFTAALEVEQRLVTAGRDDNLRKKNNISLVTTPRVNCENESSVIEQVSHETDIIREGAVAERHPLAAVSTIENECIVDYTEAVCDKEEINHIVDMDLIVREGVVDENHTCLQVIILSVDGLCELGEISNENDGESQVRCSFSRFTSALFIVHCLIQLTEFHMLGIFLSLYSR